jgi:predicted nucleic acid-binding protein
MIYEKSFLISDTYHLSFWDSLIIATALHADCTIFIFGRYARWSYPEKSLTIKNPFKNS